MAHNDCRPAILVVEDDAAIRTLVISMLHSAGYATTSTGRAAAGLGIVRKRRGALDLAIIDMVMPVMSGLDLATDLHREFPELKILYISGYVDSVAAEVISRRAPDQVLLKPFTREALLERVSLLLGDTPRREPGAAASSHNSNMRNGTLG